MSTVTKQIIDVEIKGAGDIAKQFASAGDRAGKNLSRDVEKMSKLVTDTFRKAPQHMMKSGAMRDFFKRFQDVQKGQIQTAKLMEELKKEGLTKERKQVLETELKREKHRLEQNQELIKQEAQALTKWGQRRKQIAEQAAKLHTKSLSDGIEGVFSKLETADFKNLTEAISKGVAGAGSAVKGAGKSMAVDPEATKAMKTLGKAAVGLGAAVGAVAMLASAVAAVVGIFINLDNKVKDFNKELVESQGALGLTFKTGTEGAKELTDQLKLVQDAAHDVSNNLKWMTMPKEQMAILKGFAEGNYQIKEMTKNLSSAAEQMKRLQDVTAVALTYSRLLGKSAEDVAQDMGTIMHETGIGMDRVQEGFSKVARVAQESGFNVKRFYSTVLEVTTGMTYYNIRLEEAAHLLDKFTKMLGKAPGTEFFKSIREGFAEMSYKERVKQIMVTGGKEVRKILSAESDKAADRFWKDFSKNDEVMGALQAVGDEFGLSVKGGRDLAKSLAKLSEKEYTRVVTSLTHGHKIDGEILNEIERLRALTKGMDGGLGDQAKALDDMSETGVLAMKMTSFMGKSLHEYSLTQLMAFEDMKGISGEQLKSLQNLSRQFHGAWDVMQDMSKKADLYGIQHGEKFDTLTREQKSLLDSYGAAVDEQGKIRKAIVDDEGSVHLQEEIKDLQEFIVKQNQTAEAAKDMQKEMLTKDQELAQEVIKNTEPLTKMLEIAKEGWLRRIYHILEPIRDIIARIAYKILPDEVAREISHSVAGQEAQSKQIQLLSDTIREAKESIDWLREDRSDVESKLAEMLAKPEEEQDAKEISKLEKRLKKIDEDFETLETIVAGAEAGREHAGRLDPKEFVAGGARGLGAEHKLTETMTKAEEKVQEKWSAKKETEKLAEQEKKAAKEQKDRDEKLKDKVPNEREIAEEIMKKQQQVELRRLATALDIDPSRMDDLKLTREIGTAMRGPGFAAMSEHNRKAITDYAVKLGFPPPKQVQTEDFILTDAGRLIQPTAEDTIMGLKPGGPLDKALGGGGGGRPPININIYESHNTEKTYATVKRALRDARLI